jgi:hypothetical protein
VPWIKVVDVMIEIFNLFENSAKNNRSSSNVCTSAALSKSSDSSSEMPPGVTSSSSVNGLFLEPGTFSGCDVVGGVSRADRIVRATLGLRTGGSNSGRKGLYGSGIGSGAIFVDAAL